LFIFCGSGKRPEKEAPLNERICKRVRSLRLGNVPDKEVELKSRKSNFVRSDNEFGIVPLSDGLLLKVNTLRYVLFPINSVGMVPRSPNELSVNCVKLHLPSSVGNVDVVVVEGGLQLLSLRTLS
jgi:hypothetical protein